MSSKSPWEEAAPGACGLLLGVSGWGDPVEALDTELLLMTPPPSGSRCGAPRCIPRWRAPRHR